VTELRVKDSFTCMERVDFETSADQLGDGARVLADASRGSQGVSAELTVVRLAADLNGLAATRTPS